MRNDNNKQILETKYDDRMDRLIDKGFTKFITKQNRMPVLGVN